MSQFLCSGGGDKKMATESKGSLLAKSVSKHAGRAKEKILQNLGKVDRTADEIFDEHLQNFTKQQNAATRLQKEFNNYIRCVRAMQAASKSLMDSLNEMYESGWLGHELLYTQSQNVEMLWNDFSHKLGDQVLIPMNTYQAQFPEMRKKIEKRGRKLVDYDSQRHNAQAIQASANSAKKKDEAKAAKAREQLEEAKRTYELLNSELHDELPALYDSRVLFLVTNLQTYFAAEQIFHAETSKVFAELEAIVDRLATDSQRATYSLKRLQSPKSITNHTNAKLTSPTSSHTSVNEDSSPSDDISSSATDKKKDSYDPPAYSEPAYANANGNVDHSENSSTRCNNNSPPSNGKSKSSNDVDSNASTTTTTNSVSNTTNGTSVAVTGAIVKNGANTDNLPPGVLYKVKATYKYTQEDTDELSFDVGEIIRVVEYDDPEEQEEGWLMGVKESNGEKGMFPANFTKPL
ncbi:myc box-dependent-interacting protein 1 isoform X2 [Planococcus citri]|uniref:myc box-dependent-interacting protein 1 isoform X2 n=1 Tax=Planococcus citri TaxID=170843 RepID=UPI0031F92E06